MKIDIGEIIGAILLLFVGVYIIIEVSKSLEIPIGSFVVGAFIFAAIAALIKEIYNEK